MSKSRYTKQERKRVRTFISKHMPQEGQSSNVEIAKAFNKAGLRTPTGARADAQFIASQKVSGEIKPWVAKPRKPRQLQPAPTPQPVIDPPPTAAVFTDVISEMYAVNNSNLASSLKRKYIIPLAKKIQ